MGAEAEPISIAVRVGSCAVIDELGEISAGADHVAVDGELRDERHAVVFTGDGWWWRGRDRNWTGERWSKFGLLIGRGRSSVAQTHRPPSPVTSQSM